MHMKQVLALVYSDLKVRPQAGGIEFSLDDLGVFTNVFLTIPFCFIISSYVCLYFRHPALMPKVVPVRTVQCVKEIAQAEETQRTKTPGERRDMLHIS